MARRILFFLAALLISLSVSAALAAPNDAIEKRIDQLQRENERLRDKLDQIQDKQDDAIRRPYRTALPCRRS